MPGVKMDKMRQRYEEQQTGGGEFYSFDVGETLCYVHPPCREDDESEPTDGVPYVPVTVHFSVGKNKNMVVSLDSERNPILDHPFIKRILKKRKVKLTDDPCPVGKELESGSWDDDEADEARPQTKYLWGITPLRYRKKSSFEWSRLAVKPEVVFAGKQIYDGVMEAFFDNGDISDPDAAVLVRIIRKGKDRLTKYEVKVDPTTLKKPFKVPAKLRAMLAKFMAVDSDGDLFRIVGNMIKGHAEVEAIIQGVKVDDEPDDEPDDEDDLDDSDDDDSDDDSDDSDDSDDDDLGLDDDDSDDSDSDDSDDDDDDDAEVPDPPKTKGKKAKAKTKAKAPSKAKSSSKSNGAKADDDEDLGLDDLEAALDDLDEEDKKPKGKKAKTKGKRAA
jgi:hypothetical protein